MKKELKLHIIAVTAFVVFIVLGLACASSSNVISAAPQQRSLGDRLVLAANSGSETEVRQLLTDGADVNSRATFGASNTYRITPLMNAVVGKNLRIVRLLTEYGADLDLQDSNGMTALIHAVLHKNTGIVEYLIKSGANLDIQDNETLTALLYAVLDESSDITIVKYLVDGGANITVRDNMDKIAADYALRFGKMEIYNYLVKR